MGIVALKCTSCGADVKLDDSREFGFCQFCGTKLMLVEKVKVEHSGVVTVEGIQSVQQKIDNYHTMFNNYFSEENYTKAKEYANMILDLDPKNSTAWLKLCKLLVVQQNKNVERDTKQFTIYSNNCYQYAQEIKKDTFIKELSKTFDLFLEALFCIIDDNDLAIVPFDWEIMFGVVPSRSYNPFEYLDNYYLLMKECVDSFINNVNSSYDKSVFNSLWCEFHYNITCRITDVILNSINRNRAFDYYNETIRINSKFVDPITHGHLNASLWGYRNSLRIIYDRVPYTDIKKAVATSLIYVDKWLLNIKCSKNLHRAKNQLTSQEKAEIKSEIQRLRNLN